MSNTNYIDCNESESFKNIQNRIFMCRHCHYDFGYEPHPILFGNQHAKIFQISQAPSQNVHNTGKPFNDASGVRLRREWYKISDETFYNPDNFYIASIAHCYPGKNPKGGDKHPPKYCADKWLCNELKLVKNEIYILIGSIAAAYFFPDRKLADLVFNNLEINKRPTFVLPHPSPLNINWFREHPDFLDKRIKEVEKAVHKVLEI